MFARTILLLLFAVMVAGCDQAAPPNRVPRQAAAPGIPNDPRLSKFVGKWAADDGQVVLLITRNADGSGSIASPPNPAWEKVINSVRFEGDALRYDLYCYYKGKEDFRTSTNTVGDHPYSGVRNDVTLLPGGDPNALTERMVTEYTPNGVEGTLRRQ